ncbi:MAG: hypothetical protein ORN54_04135 [Cyclobacteriaceae bacterium]|nr:hypothetical protein [Cyclobacteriaceae bacterium]
MNGIRLAVEIKDPLVKPKVDVETLASIDPSSMEDSFVYVHCHFNNTSDDMLIRIWPTTFLVDRDSAARSQLIHAENISYAPQWTIIPQKGDFTFLLIFGGLPKSCLVFDMIEEIAQPGGFHIKNIKRNETDVYHIDLL